MNPAVSILVLAVAAFVLPLVASRLKLPAVVLEILFGILAGPALLGLLHESETMESMAELGFLLLMFLSGFEIDFRKLERGGAGQIVIGMSILLLTLIFAYKAGTMLGHGPFITLVLATTSVGLVVPTLRNTQRSSTPLGQAILIAALLTDFLTLIGATLFAMVRESGFGWHLLGFPALFAAIVLVLLALKHLAWWFPHKFERLFDPEDPEEMGIRTCLFLMFVFVGLSWALNVEAILGAFMAGTAFAWVFRHRGQLEQKLKGFGYGFLIPIFFIHVGVRFEVAALARPGVLSGALLLILAATLVKMGASSVLLLVGFSPRQTLSAGVLLSARLSLVIAVAEMGVRLNLLSRELEAQVVMLAIVTSVLAPTIFRALAPPVASAEPIPQSAAAR
ncbi:MAG: cation:proton antiporter [Acidobacteria bacterium]|nr:cation:proton antiporter [Acidobacteriota bacterium]NIM61606.1 cation:proton antiporter [Acidobacteriota bacterium]NIO58161.1 cation:proton antiporter [Acidobacteriota bacterium]NIQ29174.1 cation:proton antiporter [Acidobacteriota bacterium]NIQ83714.1 cation:proton antiporter [Acidobacteriota bacterium]